MSDLKKTPQSEDHNTRIVPTERTPQGYSRDSVEDYAQETYDGRHEEEAGENSDEHLYQEMPENHNSISPENVAADKASDAADSTSIYISTR